MPKQYGIYLAVIGICIAPASLLIAQCSDAGVCAVGYEYGREQKTNTFDLLYRYGNSGKQDKISYHSIELNASLGLFKSTQLLVSFPIYRANSGSLGNATGIGDLMAFISHDLNDLVGLHLSVLAGIRLATGNDNAVGRCHEEKNRVSRLSP